MQLSPTDQQIYIGVKNTKLENHIEIAISVYYNYASSSHKNSARGEYI